MAEAEVGPAMRGFQESRRISIVYSEQIERIRQKLSEARKVDLGLKVFGASSHKYETGPGMPEQDLSAFQTSHNISFPPDFEAFMLAFGYPLGRAVRSIAGPFYGIFNLGFDRAMIPDGSQSFLSNNPLIQPGMPSSEWKKMVNNMPEDNEAYDAYERHLMSGIYTLGEQGCSSYHGLILTGTSRGKVVNFDIGYYAEAPPKFAFEYNFLDWYERWLDEVISGVIVQSKGYWFGYVMRGSETDLLECVTTAQTEQDKLNALNGFTLFNSIHKSTSEKLERLVLEEKGVVKYLALNLLTKFDLKMASPHLKALIKGTDEDCREALACIFRKAKSECNLFAEDILARLPTIDDSEAYRFSMYVLDEVDDDLAEDIAQGLSHSNVDIRAIALYHLGKRKFLPKMVPFFISGLNDDEHRVVRAALQALKGKKDIRFLEPYYRVATSYAGDDTYVLQSLEHRLDEIGFRSVSYFTSCYEAGTARAQFKKYTAGKSILNSVRRVLSDSP